MSDVDNKNRIKIQKLLENIIKICIILQKYGILDAQQKERYHFCMGGILQRFQSEDYMAKSPVGEDIDKIDEGLFPLARMLADVGKREYKRTVVSILQAILYGTGICHCILTDEEKKDEASILKHRREKFERYLKMIPITQLIDEKLNFRRGIQEHKEALLQTLYSYEARLEELRVKHPYIVKQMLFDWEEDNMDADTLEYLNLQTRRKRIRAEIAECEKDILQVNHFLAQHESELENLKHLSIHWNEDSQPDTVLDDVESEFSENESPNKEVEQLLCTYTDENSKLCEKFVEEKDIDVIHLLYEDMNSCYSSRDMNEYAVRCYMKYKAYRAAKETGKEN